MKKLLWILLALAVLAYFGLLPFHASDVAQLLPVETVIVTRSGTQYRVDVGAGVEGVGDSVRAALDALREHASGIVFFQTAEQVVVSEEATDAVEEIVTDEQFRPSAGLYRTDETALRAHDLTPYFRTRHTPLTVGRARAALTEGAPVCLPLLVRADGGYDVLA